MEPTCSDFGLRISFGSRISAFGFYHPRVHPPPQYRYGRVRGCPVLRLARFILPGDTVAWRPAGTARKGLGQSNKLGDFADFYRKRLAREFLAHFWFHYAGKVNLYRCSKSTK